MQHCSLDFASVQEAVSIPARVLVCQQGTGAGWRLCRAAQWIPPHCPTCQPEAPVGARRDHCRVLHSCGAHSSCLAEETPAVPTSGAPGHSVGPKVTGTCALVRQPANASLPGPQAPLPPLPAGRSPEPTDGQLGAERGPSHLSLPEAGARDSNGAFRLVRASYCR